MHPIKSQRVSFTGSEGRILAGIVDAPESHALGSIVLAHCFTCSKDLKASVRISRGLAHAGWTVLRFDFSGLGNSQGDFAETHFESNREDLRLAVAFVEQHYQTPALLIGHSFGGAAAMSVANEFPDLRGVVAIASPSDTFHLADTLEQLNPNIKSQGRGMVTIGGQMFPISREMLESFRRYDLTRDIASLAKPLLLFHSPEDTTVAYHHAIRIFSLVTQSPQSDAYRPPVSLLSLPGSDHLLVSDKRDIPLVVAWIDAWGRRLL